MTQCESSNRADLWNVDDDAKDPRDFL
jgi:hypothetical protein